MLVLAYHCRLRLFRYCSIITEIDKEKPEDVRQFAGKMTQSNANKSQ